LRAKIEDLIEAPRIGAPDRAAHVEHLIDEWQRGLEFLDRQLCGDPIGGLTAARTQPADHDVVLADRRN
jgi:hypothetical protein